MKEKAAFSVLKQRLVLLCTIMTGSVLTVVLAGTWLYSEGQWYQNKQRIFEDRFLTVSDQLRSDTSVSQIQLAEMEQKDRLIIGIEDNGIHLLFEGAWSTKTSRAVLEELLKERAGEDRIYTNIPPVSLKEQKSPIYLIQGEHNDKYFGAVFMVAKKNGYRSLLLLQPLSDHNGERIRQRLLILLSDILGILALFLISCWFVNKALKPVEESRRKQNEFIASASHELKSPLAVIRANAQAIGFNRKAVGADGVTESGCDEDIMRFAGGIDRECARMSGLIEDMLLLASMDARTWRMSRETVDMDTVLIDIYDLFSSYCNEKEIVLKLELEEDMLPGVSGDPERIRQILSILINNAVSYTFTGDTVIIRAYRKKHRLAVEVADHGKGIADDKKEAVFERFYRADKSRKDKNHFGLGLSIARELTILQGGELKIKDTPGGGATFQILLECAGNNKLEIPRP